ncbi:MAG TPA: asparagine synthase (glutamine-hydrolyzing) [Planktothrix sp.]
MCGIVGYLNLDGLPLPPDENLLTSMCASIRHRGPDEEGGKIVGPAALGMTRLSIIDLKTGQQPITNETGEIWIVFNGEIYNFQELQELVVARGHKLVTQSDTETIVHLYEEFGVDCLRHLEGMFSFAIFDKRKNTLFIARDRMGEKPLHWAVLQNQLVFASEIKSILLHPQSRRELNLAAFRQYLSLEYVPAPNSMFKGINKLPPAHYMLVENGEITVRKYWEPKVTASTLSQEEAKTRLIELLDRSIKLRLISDVPLGVFLSGGIDSSTVAALASRHVSGRLRTFSIGFADKSFDESEYARMVADKLGTEHEVVTFLPELAFETMQELWGYLDEPMADASIVPTFFLSKMTKRSVTVALSGEGGDELFGGYPTYQAHRLTALYNQLPAGVRRSVVEPLIRSLPVSFNNLSFDYKLKRFIKSAQQPPIRRHLRWMGAIPLAMHGNLLAADALAADVGEDACEEQLFDNLPERLFGRGQQFSTDVIDTIMRLDLTTYLPDDLLVKADRASMAASLETRLPFLAYPLIEFALSLPSSYKVNGMTTKYLLKQAMQPYLPERIIKRPKKGFGIPVAKWLRQDFKPLVDEYFCDSFLQKQGLFNKATVQELLREHNEGRVDHRKELWTLLSFQSWWARYLEPSRLAPAQCNRGG